MTNPTKKSTKNKKKNANTRKKKQKKTKIRIIKLKEYIKEMPKKVSNKETTRIRRIKKTKKN